MENQLGKDELQRRTMGVLGTDQQDERRWDEVEGR